MRTSILRPVNVYGPGMKGNVVGLIRGIRRRRMPPLPCLNNRIAMVSVHDVCRALILLNSAHKLGIGLHPQIERSTRQFNSSSYLESFAPASTKLRAPRIVFYVASICAEGLNRLRIWRNALGLRAYRNLTTDSTLSVPGPEEDFGFIPMRSFRG